MAVYIRPIELSEQEKAEAEEAWKRFERAKAEGRLVNASHVPHKYLKHPRFSEFYNSRKEQGLNNDDALNAAVDMVKQARRSKQRGPVSSDKSPAPSPQPILEDERFWEFYDVLLDRGYDEKGAYTRAVGRAEQEAELRAKGYTGFDRPRRPKQGNVIPFGRPAPRNTNRELVELPVFCIADFAGKPIPPREFFVPGLIPKGKVTLLSGDGGVGKSLLALQLAAASALGDQWLNMPVEEGVVLVLSAEDDLDEVRGRLAEIVGEERSGALKRLHVSPLVGVDPILSAPDRSTGRMVETDLFEALKRRLEALKPGLLVLDTLADLFGGDEIKRDQARAFVAMLNRLAADFGTTVLLLSHPSQSGMESGRGTSGSTSWSNSVRSRLYLQNHASDPDMRVLTLKKANYARVGASVLMRLQDGAFERVDESLQQADDLGAAKREFLRLLGEFTRQARPTSESPGHNYAPKLFSEQSGVVVTKPKFRDAMNALLANGTIEIVTEGPPSRRTKRLALAEASSADESLPEDDRA